MSSYPHMCQDGHEQIGFSNSDYEPEELSCPVCRVAAHAERVERERDEALAAAKAHHDAFLPVWAEAIAAVSDAAVVADKAFPPQFVADWIRKALATLRADNAVLMEKCRTLEMRVEELEAMLRGLEWSAQYPTSDQACCPDCGVTRGCARHEADCRLSAAINPNPKDAQ